MFKQERLAREARSIDPLQAATGATPRPAAARITCRHLAEMTKENVVVRSSSDWDVPEPWEVVKIASDGTEIVVDRTSTQDQAHSKATEQKTA